MSERNDSGRARRSICVLGLGSMGLGIATSLLRAGHVVHGFDPAADRLQAFVAEGGSVAARDAMAAQVDILVTVVFDGAQTRKVLLDPADGWAARLRKDAVVVSCATMSPDAAGAIARETEALGPAYLDAPISGGAQKAASGELSIIASGSPLAFARAAPALDAMAAVVHRLGDAPGEGSAMKMVNQHLAGIHIAAMAEALVLAKSRGLDLARVVEVISASAGTSWMFENRAPHVVDGDYAPRSSVNIWLKDLGIIGEIAAASGLDIPLATAARERFIAAADAGLGSEDDAAVAKTYAKAAGVRLPGCD